MANTIAKAIGYDKSGRVKEAHRLGSDSACAQANTWRTFATVEVNADGRGSVRVVRDGELLIAEDWEAESEPT